MTKNLPVLSGVLAIFVLLACDAVALVSADDATAQTISASMNGFAFTNSGCCPDVSTSLNGTIVTNSDGTVNLSEQNGSATIGSTTYKLEFAPSDKVSISTVTGNCSSGTTYQQNGDLRLVGNNGTIIKGSAVYSWGNLPDCNGNQHFFTNFSGNIQDSTGQPIEFYTGTDLLPAIK